MQYLKDQTVRISLGLGSKSVNHQIIQNFYTKCLAE